MRRVIDKTKPGLKSAGGNIDNLEKKTSKFGGAAKLAALGVAGIGVAGVAVGVKLVGNFLKSADVIGKMSTATGVGIEELQELDFALCRRAAHIGTFEKGIQTFNKGLIDMATKGTGPVKEGLDLIGIGFTDIKDLKPEEQFALITEAISKIEDPTEAAAAAQKLFGGAGKELAPDAEGRQGRTGGADRRRRGRTATSCPRTPCAAPKRSTTLWHPPRTR